MSVTGPLLVALIAVVATAQSVQAQSRPVTLMAGDGTLLSGTLYEGANRVGPGILLLHMLHRSRRDWAPLADELQRSGATVLALDLRGHGQSGGAALGFPAMVGDVRAALAWLLARPSVRSDSLGVVGASLGASLAAVAAADEPAVRAVGLVSPSLDYRGLRIDATVIRKLGGRPLWLGASLEDPYALRSIKDLLTGSAPREQRLSGVLGHGTLLLAADREMARALVDWLRRALIF